VVEVYRPGSKQGKPGATWVWFDANSPAENAVPRRIMFGVEPPTPTTGDGRQLAVLQNFSFSYFTKFEAGPFAPPSVDGSRHCGSAVSGSGVG